MEAALESGLYLSNRRVDGIVDGVEELRDLVDTEARVGVEDERDDDLARSERTPFGRCIARVGEHVPAVRTPNARTVVPGLDSGVTTLRTRGLFPGLLAAPLDLCIERLWT
jgi:gamma-glutamyl phosphate reductase